MSHAECEDDCAEFQPLDADDMQQDLLIQFPAPDVAFAIAATVFVGRDGFEMLAFHFQSKFLHYPILPTFLHLHLLNVFSLINLNYELLQMLKRSTLFYGLWNICFLDLHCESVMCNVSLVRWDEPRIMVPVFSEFFGSRFRFPMFFPHFTVSFEYQRSSMPFTVSLIYFMLKPPSFLVWMQTWMLFVENSIFPTHYFLFIKNQTSDIEWTVI